MNKNEISRHQQYSERCCCIFALSAEIVPEVVPAGYSLVCYHANAQAD